MRIHLTKEMELKAQELAMWSNFKLTPSLIKRTLLEAADKEIAERSPSFISMNKKTANVENVTPFMNPIPEKPAFAAVIIPADLVRRWAESREEFNRLYEASGMDWRCPPCIIESLENILQKNVQDLEELREYAASVTGKNIIQFPGMKQRSRRKRNSTGALRMS